MQNFKFLKKMMKARTLIFFTASSKDLTPVTISG